MWLAAILLLVLFAGGSYFLAQRTPLAGWGILIALFIVLLPLTSKERYDHLRLIFKSKEVFKVRLIENALLSLPFMISLVWVDWMAAVGAIIVVFGLTVKPLGRLIPYSIPTPFNRIPVAFPSGFRRLLIVHLLSWVICVFAITIDNYNMGLFSIILNWLLIYAYYGKIEPLEYVWMNSSTPKNLIVNRMREGLLGALMLILPFVICFIILDPSQWYLPVAILFLGVLNLWNVILSMLGDFPEETTIPNGIIVALSLMLPPLLLVSLFYFYAKAKNNLKTILHDTTEEHH
jgi:hypothetical protein